MKKIILTLLTSLVFSIGYAQQLSTYTESFDSGNIPSSWTSFDNGVGAEQIWHTTNNAANVYSPEYSAEINRENIGAGNTSEDWLVTDLQTIPAKSQFRFYARSSLDGDRGTVYQIRVSEASQTNPNDFTIIQSYTSIELSRFSTVYEEKVIDLNPYNGKNIYIAFVRVFAQQTNATSGDKWLLDNIRIVPECLNPTDLNATNITANTANLSWVGTAPKYDIEFGPLGFELGTGVNVKNVTSPYTATGLVEKTDYHFYVKSICDGDVAGAWTGPFKFTTRNTGSVCATPYIINALPYEVKADNTGLYGNDITTYQGNGCGAIPSSFNYLAGNDVFYSYTPTQDGLMNIIMTPLNDKSINSSIFVYGSCSNFGSATNPCLAGVANGNSKERVINMTVTANKTYIIVISSADNVKTPSIDYNLVIQSESCTPMPTALQADATLNAVQLSWTSADYSSWEIAVQPFGDAIPAGAGQKAVTNPVIVQGLTPATMYQYWVRAECSPGSGAFTSWAGPYAFNTLICEPTNSCTYTFRMTDVANNGWNGAQMQVRQNGIVVKTIGSTYTSGAGPVDIPVDLCDGLPFDLFWSVPGANPQQCAVAIINKFGQTIFSKPAGAGAVGEIVYEGIVNCETPICNITTTDVVATSVVSTSANIGWSAPATTVWDVYLVTSGTNPPTAETTPTYAGVTTNPLAVNGLVADNSYDVYVRVQCSPDNAPWSAVYTFTTTATCPKPTNLAVTDITTTSATLNWTNGTVGDSSWEVLLIPATSYTTPPTPSANPVLGAGELLIPTTSGSPFVLPIGTLAPATIYYYYIRTICSGNDKGAWTVPIFFNTLVCEDKDKCDYRFILRDTGENGWDKARMQVRQNGIVIQTIGSSITGAGPNGVTIKLCNNVPFDLYWSVAGTKPEEVEVAIESPYEDLLYNKTAGEGSPETVLFSAIGDCVKPTCPKPRNLTVNNITANTADLGWDEVGSATKWEVYVVPEGSPVPANDTPISDVAPYYIATSNPFTATGLQPSTNYIYYVRALCSDSDIGTWTIVTPKKFNTTPANDNCDTAINVPVNPALICNEMVAGSTLGATGSSPLTTCNGKADDDIWFSFVAIDPIQSIEFKNIVGNTPMVNHVVYSGDDCGALTQLYCSESYKSTAFNLTVGNKYTIRVYTPGSISADTVTFDVCITTPLPIANDECATAISVIPANNIKCENPTLGTVTGATASAETNGCIGTTDDDVWYTFVSTAEFQYIELDTFGETANLNLAVYTGECGNLELKKCSISGSLILSDGTYLIGKTYYVRVWSNSSSPEAIDFGLCIGTVLPPITTSVTEYTYNQLVQDVLLKTKCVAVSNVKGSTGVNFGSVPGIGSFDGSLSDFPFRDGVILSSGDVLAAPGPKFGNQSAGNFSNWGGDLELDKIITDATGNILVSQNASVLEFDFVPFSDKLSFNFLFASEEYGSYQCQFGDAFAFILTDLTLASPPINLAVVPSGDPISVLTIRDNKYNNGCPSENVASFGDYYGFAGGVNYDSTHEAPINFNGNTVSLVASAKLIPGHQYHIKMVIADAGDTAYDSAVFIEGKSFDLGGVNLGPDLVGKNSVCSGVDTTLETGLDVLNYDFTWEKDGVIIPNATSASLVITSPGAYTVNASFKNATCTDTDTILVEYFAPIAPGTPKNLTICNGSTSSTFDLTQNTALLLTPYPNGDHTVVYFTSDADANANTNPIATPAAFQSTTNPQTIYARVNDLVTGCYLIVTFQVSTQLNPLQFTLSGEMSICLEQSTVITVVPTNNNFDANTASYIWTYKGTVLSNVSSSLSIPKGSGAYGNYTVTVTSNGCTSTPVSFEITENTTAFAITFEEGCANNDYQLTAVIDNQSNATYQWTGPSFDTTKDANTIILKSAGTYSVKITTTDGCTSTETTTVNSIACLIQKGISPNNDDKNDFFDLSALDVSYLSIFNRYGKKVYDKSNYTNEWYGTTNDGKKLPDGTYYYVIERDGQESVTGWIYVIHQN